MKKTPPLTWFERRSVMLFASLSLAAAGQTFAPSHAPKPDRSSRSEAAAAIVPIANSALPTRRVGLLL